MPDDRSQIPSEGIAPGAPARPARSEERMASHPVPRPAAAGAKRTPAVGSRTENEVKDGLREVVETVVFVVVLVLLLKTFLAEAFVIPTGSMAPTLLGYHRDRQCDKCGYFIRVNASDEAELGPAHAVRSCVCPNCRYRNLFQFQVPGGGP